MMPCLPQHDPAPKRRAAGLAGRRAVYRYNYDHLPGVAMVDTVPARDAPSAEWIELVGLTLMKILINHAKVTGRDDFSCHHDEAHRTLLEAVRAARTSAVASALDHIVANALGGDIEETSQAGIDEYTDVFHEIRLPRCALVWDEDEQFAWYRTRGPNPMEIQRIDALDERFPVTEAQYRAVMGDADSLAAAGAEGRLFLTDYAALDGLPCGRTAGGRQKHLSAPLALFATDRRSTALQPVAIQCGQRPSATSPIFTPRDGSFAWRLAKAHVQAADANVHQAVRHLAHTHLVLEPIVVASRRHLSHHHPLAVLLDPHFEGTLEINHGAWKKLLADGGGVELVLAGEIGAVRELASSAARGWVFDERMFPTEIRSRGLDDAGVLPHYAYRKDGRLLWAAIHAWVDSYVRLYYQGPADVAADRELQAWIAEMIAPRPRGGQIQGLGENGRFETVEYLSSAVTHIIFTASVQHAAVNFPQFSMMSYAPKMPLSLYAPAPETRQVDDGDYLAALPPLNLAYGQAALGYLLGSVRYTRLGEYRRPGRASVAGVLGRLVEDLKGRPTGYFLDPRVRAPLSAFQQRLAEIEASIGASHQRFGYEFLMPSNVPQSTNI